jgi:hypothetical protein
MKNTTLNSRIIKTELIRWRELQFIQQNDFKAWTPNGDQKLQASLLRYQFIDPFKVWENSGVMYCLDGRHRYMDLQAITAAGIEVPDELPGTFIDCRDKSEAAELVLIYSSRYASITERGFVEFVKTYELNPDDFKMTVDLPDFDRLQLESMFSETPETNPETIAARSLQERFIIPPFSVFDTRQGYWQERKKQWHAIGINSQETREDIELIAESGQAPAVYELRNKMRAVLNREPSWEGNN